MQDFNPNVRLEKYSEHFEIPVSNFAMLHRSVTSILSSDVKTRGLDLSHWQDDDNINFIELKANGIDFVILKVTEHTSFVDDTFKTKYERALAAGMAVMPYHFFRGNYGGTAQAQHCMDTLRALGFLNAINYVPIVWADVETADGVSVSTRRNRLQNFLGEIVIQGLQAGVYSSPSYWNTLIGTVTWISSYWQWVAHWTSASSPTLPSNWTQDKCLFWQNGIHPVHSWVEEVIGASVSVDHNYFFGTLEDLEKLLKFPTTVPPSDCCEEHEERLNFLEGELNFLKVEIYDLQQKDLSHEADISNLFTAINGINSDIREIEGALEAQGDLLNTLENRQNVLEQGFDDLNLTVANLDVRVSDLETTEAEIRAVYNKE